MSDNTNPRVTTRQRAALISSLQGASPGLASFDDESLQLHQQGHSTKPTKDKETGSSQFTNPMFDSSTLIEDFNNIALQHRDRQRVNQHLYHFVATLSDKVDDLKKKKNQEAPEDSGEDTSAPCQSDDGKKAIADDKRDYEDDEEESSYEDEVGEQRFVDHTYYRNKIGEGFAQRQPSNLAPSKPAYFNIDDQVARTLGDSISPQSVKNIRSRSITPSSPQLLARRIMTLLKRLKPATTRQPTNY
jgi:hypothetical protein